MAIAARVARFTSGTCPGKGPARVVQAPKGKTTRASCPGSPVSTGRYLGGVLLASRFVPEARRLPGIRFSFNDSYRLISLTPPKPRTWVLPERNRMRVGAAQEVAS